MEETLYHKLVEISLKNDFAAEKLLKVKQDCN
jgi:hypothetical protein